MLSIILENLKLVGIAMGLFVGSVAANTLLGLYNNIKILMQPFEKQRLIDTALKTGCLVISIILMVLVVTVMPVFCNNVGFPIPDEYINVFSNLTIIGAAVIPSCKYLKDAYDKLCNIFNNMNKALIKHRHKEV